MAFDLSSVLKDVSKMDTQKRVEYIAPRKIRSDWRNAYSMDGIDDLASSIMTVGLQQPIVLRPAADPDPEIGEEYVIISGHRRMAAINQIMLEDRMFDDGVPCFVDRSEDSSAMQELKLLLANADTRKMTPQDLDLQAHRLEKVIKQLKAEGYVFPGRTRDWVAKLSGQSASKLARLKVIREQLTGEARKLWDEGKVSESAAYEIARRPAEAQQALGENDRDWLCTLTADQITEVMDTVEATLRGDSEETPAGADRRKEPAAPAPVSADHQQNPAVTAPAGGKDPMGVLDDYLSQREKEEEVFRSMLNECADGFLLTMKTSAGDRLHRQEAINELKNINSHRGFSLSEGFCNCSPKGITMSWHDNDSCKLQQTCRTWTEVYDILAMIAIARTWKSTPASSGRGQQWGTGSPREQGLYVVVCGVTKDERPGTRTRFIWQWDGSCWRQERSGAPAQKHWIVYRWARLPEEEM